MMKKIIFSVLIMFILSLMNARATNIDLSRAENKGEPVYIGYQGQTSIVNDFIVKNNNFLCSVECIWNTSQGKGGIIPGVIKSSEKSLQFSVIFEADKGKPGSLIVDVNVFCHDINSTFFCSDSNFGSDEEAVRINYKFCGDGKADFEEECDKDDEKGKTCIDFGFSSGNLECDEDCKIMLGECYKCGDGKINFGEQCDGSDLNGKNCVLLGFSGGSLTCNEKCTFDTSACYNCGNKVVDFGENCRTCPSDVKCSEGEECNLDRSEANQFGCAPKCGNSVCDADENYEKCSRDCKRPIKCGDDICDSIENCNSCKEDCGCLDGYICTGGQCVFGFKYKENQSRNLLIILIILVLSGITGLIYYKRDSIKQLLKKRREISVIMFTDIKDFSKKVGENEDKTLRKLWIYENIMKEIIKKYNGRVVKTMGDAIMGEFKSSINAVKCAKEIQNTILLKKDFLIKIGIHMGEVIHRRNDLFGNGVNITSRISSIAEPSSIYISEDVYRQVKEKLNLKFIDLGFKTLKNIKEQIRIYKI